MQRRYNIFTIFGIHHFLAYTNNLKTTCLMMNDTINKKKTSNYFPTQFIIIATSAIINQS